MAKVSKKQPAAKKKPVARKKPSVKGKPAVKKRPAGRKKPARTRVPQRQVLIVVDMLRGFCEPGRPLDCGDAARAIIPGIAATIERYNAAKQPVIYLQDTHEKDDPEFAMFPEHCVKGTVECDVVAELDGIADNDIRIPKNRYSGFHGTNLDELLRQLDPALIEVCGVCTNICVLYTVEELRNRYYPVRVLADLVASFDPEAHRFALTQMQQVLGAEVA